MIKTVRTYEPDDDMSHTGLVERVLLLWAVCLSTVLQ